MTKKKQIEERIDEATSTQTDAESETFDDSDANLYFNDKRVAENLKALRVNRGLTLEQLSALTKMIDPSGTGVSRVSLSRYENGDSLPGLRELRLLSFAVRRPLSALVYRDRIDPMSSYKLELDMRIMDTVMGMTLAEGVIKHTGEQHPEEDEAYLKMLSDVKKQ